MPGVDVDVQSGGDHRLYGVFVTTHDEAARDEVARKIRELTDADARVSVELVDSGEGQPVPNDDHEFRYVEPPDGPSCDECGTPRARHPG